MRMIDIMPKEKWAQLELEIHERFSVNAAVYDKNGFTFTGIKKFANPVCPAIKAKPEGLQAICAVAHQNMAVQARNTNQTVIGECDAGLMKICTPVIQNGLFIGAVSGCGRLAEEGEIETFAVEMAIGMPEAEIEKLAARCKIISEKETLEMVEFLERTVARILAERFGGQSGQTYIK